MRRKKVEGMNFLELHNQKENRVAREKERRKESISQSYKLVRNVLISGTMIGLGIYLFTLWYFNVIPEKSFYELDLNRIEGIVSEVTQPLQYGDVNFEMYSEFALLINLTTSRILFEHQADVPTYPASVTKIMTVLIGLENAQLDDEVTVTADFDALFLAGASQAGFISGEVRTLEEILYGIMLPSGAEATWALANHVAGSYDEFVAMMNEKAAEIGMNHTNFVTATGLHDENHYTTARDMAILLEYALQNDAFREIFTTDTYQLSRANTRGDVMSSTLYTFAPRMTFDNGRILGGRTGFTTPAGRCLASLATNGQDEFILITFGAPDPDFTNQTIHILDALTIYDYFLMPYDRW